MNNREIKFRVWDKIKNKFVSQSELAINGNGILLITTSGYYNDFENQNSNDFVIQQFTGLKDKNEKEIYEGDILKIKVSGSLLIFDLGTYIASVEWGNCKWKLNILTEKNKHENFNPDFYEDSGREYEIIGNIFENPELLK